MNMRQTFAPSVGMLLRDRGRDIARAPIERRPVRLDGVSSQAANLWMTIARQFCPGYVVDEHNKRVVNNIIRWLHADPACEAQDPQTGEWRRADLNRGFFLAGGTGAGKSLTMAIAAAYAEIAGLKWTSRGELCGLRHYDVRTADAVQAYMADGSLLRVDTRCVCYQDLGAETREAGNYGTRINVMGQIIETRGDAFGLITHFTSNFRLTECGDLYGDRAQSRLYAMCNYMEMRGPDRRVGYETNNH